MTLTLDQEAIQVALIDFVRAQGINLDGKDIEVSLTAGRGANGHSAEITIETASNETRSAKEAKAEPEADEPETSGGAELKVVDEPEATVDDEDEAPFDTKDDSPLFKLN